MMEKFYLKYGRASDAGNRRDFIIYRALEALPGFLAWVTILGIILLSLYAPFAAGIFVIAFDLYWVIKTGFLSAHLRAGFKKMRANLKTDWMAELEKNSFAPDAELKIKNWRDVYHLVIFPFYRESYEVIKDSLVSLAASRYPKDKFIVVLGTEERAGENALKTARNLAEEFGGIFFRFLITVHPPGIPGEIPGKGANETWAAKKAKKTIDEMQIPYERVLVSSFDIDTKVYPDYFGILTWNYLKTEKPLHCSYQPIPVFNNNIWDAPFFSRVVASSGTFWQMMQQARPERLSTFSSHSVPFKTLAEMNYWHTNIVSEDSRIFWQSLLFYDGDWRTVPLYYPVSMDANAGKNLWETAKNVYKQQRRWGWGAENFPYLAFGFLKNKKVAFRKKLHWLFVQLEGFWSWATNALIIFFLGWMPLVLGGEKFKETLFSYNLPRLTSGLMTVAMLGIISSAVMSTILLPPRPPRKKKRAAVFMILQWLCLPLAILVFGAVPGLEAQTRLMLGKYMGFWVTPKHRKRQK